MIQTIKSYALQYTDEYRWFRWYRWNCHKNVSQKCQKRRGILTIVEKLWIMQTKINPCLVQASTDRNNVVLFCKKEWIKLPLAKKSLNVVLRPIRMILEPSIWNCFSDLPPYCMAIPAPKAVAMQYEVTQYGGDYCSLFMNKSIIIFLFKIKNF